MNKNLLNSVISLRKKLHNSPEISNCEFNTRKILINFLKENNINSIYDFKDYFYVYKKSKNPKKTIVIRADHDAILNSNLEPFHGCGHDGHSAILCGTILNLWKEELDKDVIFLFQPAEENGRGAKICSEVFKKYSIDEVYGLHNWPGLEMGTIYLKIGVCQCASVGLTLKFKGVQSHASLPELGKNPAYIISKIVDDLSDLNIFRGYSPFNFRNLHFKSLVLVTVINISLGSKNFGISPANGELSLTLRAAHDEDLNLIKNYILNLARDLCEEDFSLQFEFTDEFSETYSDPSLVKKAEQIFSRENLKTLKLEVPFRASEDFGVYKKYALPLFFYLGNGVEHIPLHNDNFEFSDEILENGIKAFSVIARNF
ncbi:amidohydrolase [Anaerosphaera aminiphila DSM 21120]|uniref:Amidohydrolase n=1 Tax=Anaerosphaera aminiphila DSM 21120 TaxID=1120995 RepID=A0A1M5RZP1_9FIRM|nr:M20 family metallopeptidase [Anaerosphaera aminiphila]SHH31644.1 amidohydrolase [Anaerosphaera aminiphila DSM 21120]